MSTREIEHAALLWHSAHERRRAIGAEKRRLERELQADVRSMWNTMDKHTSVADASRRLTPAKQRELNALRRLAKVCQQHREHMQQADVIDVEVKQISTTTPPTTTKGI